VPAIAAPPASATGAPGDRRRAPSAVAAGIAAGHWDPTALAREAVIGAAGELARAVVADLYDATGLPGSAGTLAVRDAAARVLAGPAITPAAP
jgi:hypothetical protein